MPQVNRFERTGDKTYRSQYVAICRACKGSGSHPFPLCNIPCDTCNGCGRVLIVKEIKVTVEPYNN
jgi:DnaJ-class molecular chaperone